MPDPGYYDVTFPQWVCEVTEPRPGAIECGPEVKHTVTWLGARVLVMDGPDAIVEHHPEGWGPNVLRRIDRVSPAWGATFKPIDTRLDARLAGKGE